MKNVISAKELRAHLSEVVEQVRRGGRFTVLYRSRPVFVISPPEPARGKPDDLENEPFYRAGPLGASTHGDAASRHDEIAYRL